MGHEPLDETSLRAVVHQVYDAVAVSPDPDELTARLRRGVVRSRVRHMATTAVGGLALVAMAVGLAAVLPRDHGGTGAASRPLPACPVSPQLSTGSSGDGASRNGAESAPRREGTDTSLVPGTPDSALACDFKFTRTVHGPFTATLLGSRQLTGAHLADALSALNTPLSPAGADCPLPWTINQLTLVFGYATGPAVTVQIDLDGCPWVTNGVMSGMFGAHGVVPPALTALGP